MREDSGIDTVEDLKGRRWPRLIASTSMNRKLEAILNFGGLTSADVELVDISYSEQVEAMKTGHIDAFYQNVVGAAVEELDSQYPIKWLNLGGGSPEQYATWERLAPMVIPGEFTHGAGIEPGEVGVNMQYSIPLTTLADRPKDEVKALLGLIKDNYDSYKDATPDAHMFGVDEVLLYPSSSPSTRVPSNSSKRSDAGRRICNAATTRCSKGKNS
ncbi:TAXI family TRAP transporter solute-binding subunit [Corynebacterium yudongzhengii]|uniref:TAXI family TRAP transporter solute-binding subunit n=1 Tax=Corynebacterium yudongzhengii TaxID=2080740 RepID=UPI001F23F6A7|nr:TAXI family TRAP transporter solute-binding subunit [Corynebacterium yudongzhengii]